MKIVRLNSKESLCILYIVILAVFSVHLYANFETSSNTRKIQGVVAGVTPSGITLNIEKSNFLIFPNEPDIRFHQFAINKNTKYILQSYVMVGDKFVSLTGLPQVTLAEVYLGDAVSISYDSDTGAARTIFIGNPTLWY